MLTSKIFLKKTKRGNILKIVREHYLRDDIGCGSFACDQCLEINEFANLEEKPPINVSKAYRNPHYLVVDTNVVLHQIDVLEADVLHNIIILQTVLEEVKHRSSTIYKRLKDLISNTNRKFYVFVNEHHKDTYIEREPGESANDRNDRAIRVAALWYDKHLKEINPDISHKKRLRVVLLTDDAANKEKATKEGLFAASIEDYVNCLHDSKGVEDKISKADCSFDDTSKELFPCHLTPVQIHDGIKSGKLLQGSFQASRDNFLEGQVNVESFEKPILVQGHSGLNRAVDGDTVAVELLPKEQWSAPSEIVLDDNATVDNDNELSEIEIKPAELKETTPTGKVVGIIRRKWRQYCGILQESTMPNSVRHIFVPAERKIPKIRIETRQAATLMSQRIIVAIDSWSRYSRYPSGHFVRALGKIGDKATENEVLLLEHDVPHSDFSDKVKSCLPKLPWIITDDDVAKREDLRHIDICSVDPPGCTDIDDALHCKLLDNGNYEVGVHIADVSHFIRPGTAIDEEAALRATTVYLVDKRIDMVPELLSSNLCSLRGNEERFAFSCIWEITDKAEIVKTRFCKSIIRSKAAFTYEEAQLIIDDASKNDSIAKSLRGLNKLAKILKRRRIDNGALVLASPEIRFYIDSETHDPIEVQAKKIRETNSMVEEFMLLANVSVAEKIYLEFPEYAVLRRHPTPPISNFDPLIKVASQLGFEMNISSNKELAQSLDLAVKKDNPYFNTMLRILATRCMLQAVYFSSGVVTKEDFYHYGLAAPIYTHFTSPIRRYADILVHRLLAACIGADQTYPNLLNKRKISEICNNLNYRNRMAQYAGRASVALHTHIFFREKIQDEEGYILYVKKNALQILIPKYGLEGTLYLTPPKGVEQEVTFTYNDENHTQTYKDIVFHMFDPVTVQLSLDRSNVQHEKLVFKLVKPYIPKFSVPSAGQTELMEVDEPKPCEKRKEEPESGEQVKEANRKRKKKKK
ncbi:exosome complex exonuclease RRP44 [Planococcus citri]|uniref:exosome complex exonuclease RRP44 n=1 Tax=Planococcus citri TaxID=170843 RepID=UPI0031FA369C